MIELANHQDRVEFETPPYGTSFIFQAVFIALVALGLHIWLFWLATDRWWSNAAINSPAINAGALGYSPVVTVMPGSTAVVKGEVWTSVVAGKPIVPGSDMVRPASSRLVAIDLKTGKARETQITLSPSPAGLLTIDDQLWCVAETVVYRIENGEAIPRHPRRVLIQPSKPFVHHGRLAVIDKNRNDIATLLTWKDGEWSDEGTIDIPIPVAGRWVSPELRALYDGKTTYILMSEGQNILYREGFSQIQATDPEPASALEPENVFDIDKKLSAMATSSGGLPALGRNGIGYSGWKTLPITLNWWAKWEAALVNGELMIFTPATNNGYNSSPIQQYRIHNGNAVTVSTPFPPETSSFGVAGGESGYLVTDDLRLFKLDGTTFERVTAGPPMTERFRSVLARFRLMLRYLISTGLLVLGIGGLMRLHRKPEYLYGKRNVILASLMKRAIARGIDFVLTVFPALFWLSVVMNDDTINKLQQQTSQVGIQNPLVLVLLSIIGMWFGITLVLCYMEGFYGFTPGKWLMGIRTLRTTLRRCGMLRSFARELLVYVDGLFFLTWLPGVLLIALTPHWQRMGDLTADTIVINDPDE